MLTQDQIKELLKREDLTVAQRAALIRMSGMSEQELTNIVYGGIQPHDKNAHIEEAEIVSEVKRG